MDERLWSEPQPGESFKAYDAFKSYINERRPRPGWRKWSAKTGISLSTINFWRAEHNWEERIRAHDAWMDATIDRERNKQLSMIQTQVVGDELADYQTMQGAWRMAMDFVSDKIARGVANGEIDESTLDMLNKLALARSRIDTMARKSAQLPAAYAAKEGGDVTLQQDDSDILLDFHNGPTIIRGQLSEKNDGGEIPAAPRLSEDS